MNQFSKFAKNVHDKERNYKNLSCLTTTLKSKKKVSPKVIPPNKIVGHRQEWMCGLTFEFHWTDR